MDKLFEVKEGLFQVVRPCTDNGVWKKGLQEFKGRRAGEVLEAEL